MLDTDVINEVASALDNAEREKHQIDQISSEYPDMDIQDSYAIQHAWSALKISRGLKVKGRKIGLTSRAMQQAVQINEPDYGVLFDNMFFEDGAVIEFDNMIEPRLEAELAFILERDLTGPDCTLLNVLDATAFVTPALEILDARIVRKNPETGRMRTVLDTIADNAANCALVLGGRPMRPLETDLRRIAALCYRNSHIEETGVAAGVLNHPASGVAWLANRLHPYGETLKAGQVILSGSFIRPIHAERNDTFYADYGPWGTISCQFQ